MKYIAVIGTLIISISLSVFFLIPYVSNYDNTYDENSYEVFNNINYQMTNVEDIEYVEQINYQVYIDEILSKSFYNYEEALNYAQSKERAAILNSHTRTWVWDNYPLFNVIIGDRYEEFPTFTEAVDYAKKHENSIVTHRINQAVVWSNATPLKNSVRLNVPNILQQPELPRGCEVTALAILLNYAGLNVDKMELASKVKKDPTERQVINGVIHGGNINYGFVGDMYNSENFGLGVNNGPIFELMKEYLPNAAINLTNANFEDLLFLLNRDIPIWVITNATYNVLPNSSFETWKTSQGDVKITFWMHAVVISGYDDNYIYFTDPLGNRNHAPREQFIAAWEQMGSQAIAYAF